MAGSIGLSESWFKVLLTLVAVALSTNILVGPSVRWRPIFISGVLVAVVTCEYYYLFFAVMKLPRDWAESSGAFVQRLDCRQSTKGGKSGEGSLGVFDINPCFCVAAAKCKNLTSGLMIPPSSCPTDGSGLCWQNQKEIPLYIEPGRDCSAAQGSSCTKEQPCTPCALDTLETFKEAGVGDLSRCRRCGPGNRGGCHFVLDEGPYCWKQPGSLEVEPCSVCCTEPEVMELNGTCY